MNVGASRGNSGYGPAPASGARKGRALCENRDADSERQRSEGYDALRIYRAGMQPQEDEGNIPSIDELTPPPPPGSIIDVKA